MKVYRLENNLGEGPFIAGPRGDAPETLQHQMAKHIPWLKYRCRFFDMECGLQPDETHPFHAGDIPNMPRTADDMRDTTWRVACQSEELLYHWFPQDSLPFFHKHGFAIAIYECHSTDVYLGQYQCVFCYQRATLVETRK